MSALIKYLTLAVCLGGNFVACVRNNLKGSTDHAATLLQNRVLELASDVLRDFHAGSGYGRQVWIRDANTFLDEILREGSMGKKSVRSALLEFFKHTDPDEGVPDWVEFGSSNSEKNTVETDQETSLIQALYKYVAHTNDTRFLEEKVELLEGDETTVKACVEKLFTYLMTHRLSPEHNLIFGATTVDWGDVQAKGDGNVILMGSDSHLSIDVYDNAMMVQALSDYAKMLRMSGDFDGAASYRAQAADWKRRIRAALWDKSRRKWRPHLYLSSPIDGQTSQTGSPFPDNFEEDEIFYHGGTSIAMLAGLNTKAEGKAAYYKMKKNAQLAGKGNGLTVGLAVYPPYPEYFGNPPMKAYFYQNGGDWPWFGGRTVQALVKMGHLKEAREALTPMVERAVRERGFHEWYDQDNRPQGSATFHGAAGALATAIRMLRAAESARV